VEADKWPPLGGAAPAPAAEDPLHLVRPPLDWSQIKVKVEIKSKLKQATRLAKDRATKSARHLPARLSSATSASVCVADQSRAAGEEARFRPAELAKLDTEQCTLALSLTVLLKADGTLSAAISWATCCRRSNCTGFCLYQWALVGRNRCS